jgi:hypothetical protein
MGLVGFPLLEIARVVTEARLLIQHCMPLEDKAALVREQSQVVLKTVLGLGALARRQAPKLILAELGAFYGTTLVALAEME